MAGAAKRRGRARAPSRAGSQQPLIPEDPTFSEARYERAPPLLPVGEEELLPARERLSPTIAGPSHAGSHQPFVAEDEGQEEEYEEEEQGLPPQTPTSSIRTSQMGGPSLLALANSELLAEVQRKRQAVTALRLQQELASLNAEIEGQEPEVPIEIAGTTLPVRKRPASMQLTGRQKMPKVSNPKTYSGESLEELTEYAAFWQVQYEHPDFEPFDDGDRIKTAATALRGYALQRWSKRTETPETWDEYLEYQRALIRAPANRMSDAIRGIWHFRPREGQTAQQILADLVKLRAEIRPLSDEERRAWELLMALRLELRLKVQGELPTIETEDQVLRSAQRQEELLFAMAKGKGKETYADAAGKQPPSKPKAGAPLAKKWAPPTPQKAGVGSSKKERTTPSSNSGCFVCGDKGHLARDCPKKATSKGIASISSSKSEKPKPSATK